jgi:hypothetical protein
MNPASGVAAGFPAGTQGNAFPMFGTGSVMYGQVGYLMKRNLLGADRGTLMPYAQVQIANYNRITQPLGVYNLGINYLINGHNAKFTLDYQNRPSHRTDGNQFTPSGRRGQLTLQYQLFI